MHVLISRSFHTHAQVVVIAWLSRVTYSVSPLVQVLLMSATINADLFSSFFNKCPVLRVPGRQHPVTIMYTEEPQVRTNE